MHTRLRPRRLSTEITTNQAVFHFVKHLEHYRRTITTIYLEIKYTACESSCALTLPFIYLSVFNQLVIGRYSILGEIYT